MNKDNTQHFEMNTEEVEVILNAISRTKALFSIRELEVLSKVRNDMKKFLGYE